MNYTKGLVRAWLVGCSIWVGSTVFMSISVSDVLRAFNYWTFATFTPATWDLDRSKIQDEGSKNRIVEVTLPDGSIAEFPENTPPSVMISALDKKFPPNAETNMFKKQQNLRKAHNSGDIDTAKKLATEILEFRASTKVKELLGIAFLPPFAILLLGVSLGWVAAGFSRKHK